MSGLENLVPLIYHEKQQPGSMLCAQHALNSLLQGNYFTAPDLSAIAQSLDTLEERYDDDRVGRVSANMDDTGFFSVQVLENALNVWGLSLVRWRSEAMRAYQDHPHTQLAFILNLNQHWFTLRRFGNASPNMDEDEGDGHWFNLNSFLDAPEWVSKTYLGMVLQQAEAEGYSVFAITQTDPEAPLALTRTEADTFASGLPAPTSIAPHLSTVRTPRAPAGLEDEDFELQAALQASLGGSSVDPQHWAGASGSSSSSSQMLPPLDANIFTSQPQPPPLPPASTRPDGTAYTPNATSFDFRSASSFDPNDPVAASTARNRALFERMRAEQEFALRDSYEVEVANFGRAGGSSRPAGEDNDENEMLRRAIAESEALARGDGDEEVFDEDADEDMRSGVAQPPPGLPAWAQNPALGDRVYDDDDQELQAALRASLESVPPGFTIPDTPPRRPAAPLAPGPAPVALSGPQALAAHEAGDDKSSATETETEADALEEHKEENVDMEEMRRRRLARFGAGNGP